MQRFRWIGWASAVLAASLGAALVPTAAAQPSAPSRGGARGLFGADYRPPEVRALESADSFEKMVQNGKIRLSEADLVRLVLENSPDIQVERYGPYFTLWGVQKARASRNPTFTLASRLDRMVTPAVSVLQGGETFLDLMAVHEARLHVPFETGLDLDVSLSARRYRTGSFFFTINPSLTSMASVSFTQHLLRDAGSISRGRFLRIARNDYGISEEDFAVRVTRQVAAALETYWDLAFVIEEEKGRQGSVDLAKLVLDQVRAELELGTKTPLDVAQAQAELAARNERLITARSTRGVHEDRLKSAVSSQLDPGVIAAAVELDAAPAAPAEPSEPLAQAIQRALEIRPEVRRASLELENRKIQVAYTRNQLRPTLDVVAGYTQLGLGGDRVNRDYTRGLLATPVISVEPGGFWDSLDSFFGRRYLGYSVGFTFRVPLGNDEARANSGQAQVDERRGEANLRLLRHQVALEVREAHGGRERDRARLAAAEAGLEYSEKRLRGEQDSFKLGEGTTRYVLEAQRDLEESRMRVLRARIDLIKSQVAFQKATGDLLSAHQVTIKAALGSLH